jgi:hypothetical protein
VEWLCRLRSPFFYDFTVLLNSVNTNHLKNLSWLIWGVSQSFASQSILFTKYSNNRTLYTGVMAQLKAVY